MPATGKKNIIVVDDEKQICNVICEALSSEKLIVTVFTDPALAISHLREHPADLVLTDLAMGELSGLDVLEAARASHPDVICILMTAHPTVQTAIAVLKKGAYDFIVKPFKLEELKAAVKRGLGHQQVIRENMRLKGQVEFLKVAHSFDHVTDIENYLGLVVKSCANEMSAKAVGLIEVDPKSRETVRKIHHGDDEEFLAEVLDEASLDRFSFTKARKAITNVREVQSPEGRQTRVLISQPIFIRRKLCGVINILIQSRFEDVTPGQMDILIILANSAASALANNSLYHDLQSSYLQAIHALANAIEARDPYTAGHTDRVTRLAELLAVELGWDQHRIYDLRMGCTLHDIGKLGVPDSILHKQGLLTEEERCKMATHAKGGVKIIRGVDLFKPAIPYIVSHHEQYDGSGYPKGLKGKDIPIEGRLLAIVDTFDAILSNRPYREGASVEYAVSELEKFSGIQFDPELVMVFLDMLSLGRVDFRQMYNRDEDLSFLRERNLAKETETAKVSV